MYLVICKNKHGLSIELTEETQWKAEAIAKDLNERSAHDYYVRRFNLASIDLDKLMENK